MLLDAFVSLVTSFDDQELSADDAAEAYSLFDTGYGLSMKEFGTCLRALGISC